MIASVTAGLRKWIVGLFAGAIKNTSRPEDRQAAIQWLLKSRDILASDLSRTDKLKALNALINSRAAISGIAASVAEAVREYKTSNLPLSMKIALPVTVLAMPVVGMHGAGIVAFGGGIGLPVLLLVFLGTAGISAIIEAVAQNPNSRDGIAGLVLTILAMDMTRRASAAFREAMRDAATAPRAASVPDDEIALRAALLSMDPFDFECHVMSFFDKAGLYSIVTPRSNDFGMDGYAAHPNGLIVVQCKRNGPDNKVGRPVLTHFKSVIADQDAWRGYIVTTSTFSREAKLYVAASPNMFLVDIDELVRWHRDGLRI